MSGMTKRTLVAFCIALVAIVGLLDHKTGYEMSFSIFYVVPIGIASWYGGRKFGYWVAILSAFVWLAVDFTAGHKYSLMIIPFWNTAVRLSFFVVIGYLLVAVRNQLIREVENATTDKLTGLRNPRGFISDAERIWSLAIRHGHTTSLAYLDLDNFKQINDDYGHAEGDILLKMVADVLVKSFRSTDILARLGGDEFVALLPESDRNAAEEVSERVRTELHRIVREHGRSISISIGVVVMRIPYPTLDQALKAGDELLYRAKRAGKNRVLVEECGGDENPVNLVPKDQSGKPGDNRL